MVAPDIKERVDAHIKNDKVYAATKSYCPHCKATKKLFEDLNIEYEYEDLDLIPEGPAIQAYLLELTGQRTVPNIFIKGQHIGGNSDLQALHKEGKLLALL
jgi:glutaredoxin 3